MTRVKFFRHDKSGAVDVVVVSVTQSIAAIYRSVRRYPSVAEAERVMTAKGWTRKRLKPLATCETHGNFACPVCGQAIAA